jgi:hypothetical protein
MALPSQWMTQGVGGAGLCVVMLSPQRLRGSFRFYIIRV